MRMVAWLRFTVFDHWLPTHQPAPMSLAASFKPQLNVKNKVPLLFFTTKPYAEHQAMAVRAPQLRV